MEKVFESEHIIYVKLDYKLIDDYLIMINDPEIQNKISHIFKIYTKEEEYNWVKSKLEEDALSFSMIEKNTNKYIGNIEIMSINNNIGELGISITSLMQNKHYGTESIKKIIEYAYDILNLDGLELNVYSTNPRAIHCYEKLGFVKVSIDETNGDIHMLIKKYRKKIF